MFHRVPFISTASVVTAAVILVLAALFALSLSSPGTALAEVNRQAALDQETLESKGDIGFPVTTQDPDAGYRFSSQGTDLPEVSIYAVMPEVGEEARSITVTLKLSRPLRADEKFCYPARSSAPPHDEVCIQGGIIVWDTYDDHLYEEGGSKYDNGLIPSNERVKFVFRGTEVEKRLSVSVYDDECITPERTIRVAINQAFDSETYGYTINPKENPEGGVVPIDDNDTVNGTLVADGGECESVDEGATEEFIYNHAPLFTDVTPTRSVAENTALNQDIGDPVTASDPEEGDTLTYSLGDADGSSFAIDSSSGQLRTNAALDYEDKNSYTVTVQVRDSMDIDGDPDMTYDDSIDITIEVTDVNEPPAFDSTVPTTLNIIENTTAGTDIGSPVTATDPDNTTANPTKDTLTYSLDTGDGASFEIDSSGQIKTKDPLDRETKDTYTVTVSVSDSKDEGGNADTVVDDTHTLTITIGNGVEPPTFNEEPPQGQNNLARSVAENTPAGSPIGNPVSATSEDGATLTYSLVGTDASSFDIDSGNGQIKTKAALDYESARITYSVTVSVTDGKDANGITETLAVEDATIAVTINVTDVNEPPQFADDAPITQTVAENTAADTNIGSAYTATDPENDALTYTLDSGSAATFEIDANGQLKTKADLNYEADSSYTVIVQVTDSRDDNGVADTATDAAITVTITVTDEDDPGSITFSSDPPIAGTTLTAVLEDQDGVKSDVAVTWKWEISTDQTNWNTITDAATNSYTPGSDDIGDHLRVTAIYDDENGPGKTAQTESGAILTAPPTNLKPSFTDPTRSTTRTVAENTPAGQGQPIGAPVAATHLDNVGTLTYSLGGTDAASFNIVETTGQLRTKVSLDYESGPTTYHATVSVTDALDDYSNADTVVDDTIAVTINVTDINEKPQFADDAATTLEVSEDTATGVDIGDRYEATDPDPSDTVTYSVTGTDAALFQVDSNGQLRVGEALDFETKPSLAITLSVTDSKDDEGTLEDTPLPDDSVAITITVTNVFEAPRFSDEIPQGESSITRSVPENTEANQDIGVPVSVTDDESDTLTYTLGGTDVSSFEFDTITGQIKTKDALDHETQDSYSVTVSVTDSKDDTGATETNPATDATITVTIEVEDVNEKPTFDANLITDLEIAENTSATQDIGSPFTATDPDPADTLTYGLTGTDAASFDIDDETGQIKIKDALDYETKETYTVTVTVRDSRDDNGDADTDTDATTDVTITATDEDDSGTITFSTDHPSAGTTLTATLTDDDAPISGETWVWGKSADGNTWTTITGATANSYIPQPDDVNNYLKVTVTYTDSFDSGKTAQARTDIKVLETTPTNEQPSFADGAATMISVLENTPAGENIGDPFTATDEDDNTLTYVLGGTDAASFDIVDTTGQIQTKEVLDHETKDTYSVTVSVHDGKDPFGNPNAAADGTIDVTIDVTDMVIPAIPEQPTVNATPGAAAGLTVTWPAIEPTDESPVDGYDVQYRVKDTTNTDPWLTTNVTVIGASATITGLAYSTTYEVQVRSKNVEGDSEWSPTGEGTIPSSLSVSFSSGSETVNEGSSATFTVTVSPAADRDLTISVSASSSNAESNDYSVSGTPLSFVSGEMSKSFTILTTDDSDRNDETVNLAFGQLPAAVGTGTQSTAQLTINDTTPAPRGGGGGAVAVAAGPSQARFPCHSAKRRTP